MSKEYKITPLGEGNMVPKIQSNETSMRDQLASQNISYQPQISITKLISNTLSISHYYVIQPDASVSIKKIWMRE